MNEDASIIAAYAQQADRLELFITGCPAEIIARRPDETRWSILEIVGHLADAELLASVRIRRVITGDRPNLYGYRQEEWARKLGYRQQRIAVLSQRFALLRRENGELLGSMSGDDWNRGGEHDESGRLTLRQLIVGYLEHTAKHLNQAESIAAELTAGNHQL
ncbi:MAG TPA: DinB family protein [Blastocatellia bacterium]|nr:DinB family protein [Blastocatellia bacterium]